MNRRLVVHCVFLVMALVSVAILLCAGCSFLMNDPDDVVVRFYLCGGVPFLLSLIGFVLSRPKSPEQRQAGLREGFAIVGLSWMAASVLGALPYLATVRMHWYDALFESVSGFTTTGASILSPGFPLANGDVLVKGIESLSHGLLFWRATTQWLGGMGIIVLALAVLPLFNIGGQALYNAETPGVKGMDNQIAPRIASSAKILWLAYVFLTLCETIVLLLGGMSFFDSLCHSFATISTGGFSTKTASVAHYDSVYLEVVLTVFMFLSGCNFYLHFRLITGRPLQYLKDAEFRFYSGLILICSAIVAVALAFTSFRHDFWNGLLKSVFQVVSIITSTGFTSADYMLWPSVAVVILMWLMIVGGCGGSTSGGVKCVRVLVLWKQGVQEVRKCIFPRMVSGVHMNGRRVEESTVRKTLAFASLYTLTIAVFALLLAAVCPQADFVTAFSASATSLSNSGPGVGLLGPSGSFGWMNPAGKTLLAFEMILGRLELYTIFVMFLPSFWRR